MSPERGKAFDAAFTVASHAELTAALDRLEDLAKAATPGPWKAGRPDMATIVDGVESKWIYAGEQYCAVASGRIDGEWSEVMANAQLIAYSRTALPALVKAFREALPILEGPATECMCHLETRKPCRGCRIRSALAKLAEALR